MPDLAPGQLPGSSRSPHNFQEKRKKKENIEKSDKLTFEDLLKDKRYGKYRTYNPKTAKIIYWKGRERVDNINKEDYNECINKEFCYLLFEKAEEAEKKAEASAEKEKAEAETKQLKKEKEEEGDKKEGNEKEEEGEEGKRPKEEEENEPKTDTMEDDDNDDAAMSTTATGSVSQASPKAPQQGTCNGLLPLRCV